LAIGAHEKFVRALKDVRRYTFNIKDARSAELLMEEIIRDSNG